MKILIDILRINDVISSENNKPRTVAVQRISFALSLTRNTKFNLNLAWKNVFVSDVN